MCPGPFLTPACPPSGASQLPGTKGGPSGFQGAQRINKESEEAWSALSEVSERGSSQVTEDNGPPRLTQGRATVAHGTLHVQNRGPFPLGASLPAEPDMLRALRGGRPTSADVPGRGEDVSTQVCWAEWRPPGDP